jgi:phosphoribosylformylglycinamidine synthase
MLFYHGFAINFKGETHISPTFGGSAYGGIMTKHGGVIRDVIFTGQGAYPIAGTTIMATCDPRMPWEKVPPGAFHPRTVLTEAIRGTHDYTNPMGIPMTWSKYLIHPNNWKGFVLGHSIGIMPENRAKKGQPIPGDFVVLIGGLTGIDGIHGATVSSSSMTSETATRDAAHVQIGMPIEERKIMEAIPVLRDSDCIRACTDCGAAGLSSAVGEMGSACGVWANLAWVPLKCTGMKPWEIWLSESQERGVLAIPPEKLEIALAILESYGVPAAVIGVFTDTDRCQVVFDEKMDSRTWSITKTTPISGLVAVDLPYSFLTAGCPLPKVKIVAVQKEPEPRSVQAPTNERGWINLVQEALGHYNICDQSPAAYQFDGTVQGTTVLTYVSGPEERMPDELSVRAPIFGKRVGQGHANAVNQFYGEVDAAGLGRLMDNVNFLVLFRSLVLRKNS